MIHNISHVQKLAIVVGHIYAVALSNEPKILLTMYFIALQVHTGVELQSKELHLMSKVSDLIFHGKIPDNDYLRIRFSEG